MKRSEMVIKLQNIINFATGEFDDVCISRQEAGKILTKIEELGMLPPRIKTNESIVPYIKDNNDQGMDFDTEDLLIYRNQWEPENEKN